MGTPVYRQQGVLLLRAVAPHIPTCHARMFECAAAQASGGNRQLYALLLEEFVREAETFPELSASSVLQRALRPLQRSGALPKQNSSNSGAARSASLATHNSAEHKLVCPVCRSCNESVMPFEKQRRSADEPAHQYAQCLNDDCRHVWLVSS